MTISTISTVQLRSNIGDIINRVSYSGERIVLEKHGKPVAAIVSMDELRRLELLEDERDAELLRLARAASEGVVPFAELAACLEQLHGESFAEPAKQSRDDDVQHTR